ncbi:hypothetical protein [Cupriavidus basilensis]|uniref:SLOG domain-containing protein n=1 Tax=Cupriavidus basilensis TaxID=68895 RepID=UPI001F50F6FE|nr:hypothetical protein [Cupriavidus basilensis]
MAAVDGDLSQSLKAMREAMMKSADFDAAVFIGGMEGILNEHAMFIELHPQAKRLPVAVTGGASRILSKNLHYPPRRRRPPRFRPTFPSRIVHLAT